MSFQSSLRFLVFTATALVLPLVGHGQVATSNQLKENTDEIKFPSPQQIIEKNIEALGGHELLSSRSSVHYVCEGRSSTGREYTYEYYQTEGNFHSRFDYLDGNVIRRGVRTDGTLDENGKRKGVVWEYSNQSLREMVGEERQGYLRRRSKVSTLTSLFEHYKAIKFVSSESIDGREHYKLLFTDHDDKKLERYYDAKTGLLRRQICDEAFSNQEIRTVRDYLNYELVGEFLISKKQTATHGTTTWTYDCVLYEVDVKIPRGSFTLPKSLIASWNATLAPPKQRVAVTTKVDTKKSKSKESPASASK